MHSGQREVVEDWSEQAGHHLQANDHWDQRGEDLSQVRERERLQETVRERERL